MGKIDITPSPWVPLILAGRYQEAEQMKRNYIERRKDETD